MYHAVVADNREFTVNCMILSRYFWPAVMVLVGPSVLSTEPTTSQGRLPLFLVLVLLEVFSVKITFPLHCWPCTLRKEDQMKKKKICCETRVPIAIQLIMNRHYINWIKMINFINLIKLGLRGGMVSPHSKRVPSPNPGGGLSVWSVHVPPVCAWVLSVYFGFLPPPKKTCMSG